MIDALIEFQRRGLGRLMWDCYMCNTFGFVFLFQSQYALAYRQLHRVSIVEISDFILYPDSAVGSLWWDWEQVLWMMLTMTHSLQFV